MSKPLAFRLVENWASLVLLILLVFLPVYGPFMVYAEGAVFPVTSKITIVSDVVPPDGGHDIRFSYTKYRSCEAVGIAARVDMQDVGMDLVPGGGLATRGIGGQVSRLWHVDSPTLTGLDIWFLSRCHPFWLTATKVYG